MPVFASTWHASWILQYGDGICNPPFETYGKPSDFLKERTKMFKLFIFPGQLTCECQIMPMLIENITIIPWPLNSNILALGCCAYVVIQPHDHRAIVLLDTCNVPFRNTKHCSCYAKLIEKNLLLRWKLFAPSDNRKEAGHWDKKRKLKKLHHLTAALPVATIRPFKFQQHAREVFSLFLCFFCVVVCYTIQQQYSPPSQI